MRYIYKAIVLCLIALLLVGAALPVAAGSEEFVISVTNINQTDDTAHLSLEIENNAGSKISYGWVNSCKIVVTTTEGTYEAAAPRQDIPQGYSSCEISVSHCPGKIISIVITDLRLLDGRGLPSERLSDVEIYNTVKHRYSYTGSFAEDTPVRPHYPTDENEILNELFGTDNPQKIVKKGISYASTLLVVGAVVGGVIFVAAIVVAVILIKKQKKGSEATAATFMPFTATTPNDMTQQMHSQAHQQAVNQFNQQQFNDFSQRSATTMDMGGFTPPPPPPPPGV